MDMDLSQLAVNLGIAGTVVVLVLVVVYRIAILLIRSYRESEKERTQALENGLGAIVDRIATIGDSVARFEGKLGTAVSIPGLTTTGNDRLVVDVIAHRVDLAVPQLTGWTNASLTELTEQVDEDRLNSTGYGFAVCTGVKAASGVVSATTATLANTSTQARIKFALQP